MKSTLIFILFSFQILNNTNAQSKNKEIHKTPDSLLEILNQFTGYNIKTKNIIKKLELDFCESNNADPDGGTQILKRYFENYNCLQNILHNFLINNYQCFDANQIQFIKDQLPLRLSLSDLGFHQLVSIFKLKHFHPLIEQHISLDVFEGIRRKFPNRAQISDDDLFQLTNIATLANLGKNNLEDSLTTLINDLHKITQTKNNDRFYARLYNKILPKSLGYLNSISSIHKTIKLFDDDKVSEDYEDVIQTTYAYQYFLYAIFQKLKSLPINPAIPSIFQLEKSKIRADILAKNLDWKAYIQ